MSEIRVSQPHTRSVDEARAKMRGFEDMVSKYGVTSAWTGDRAALKGTGVSGSIVVSPASVDVVVKLGMVARAFGVDPVRLEASIRRRLEAAFAS
jgi:putative polyhydroxyalkanoate system protein